MIKINNLIYHVLKHKTIYQHKPPGELYIVSQNFTLARMLGQSITESANTAADIRLCVGEK